MKNNNRNNSTSEINLIREKVDKLDDKIIKLLIKRQMLVAKIGIIKRENNLEILCNEREKNILKRQVKVAEVNNFDVELVKKIYRLIFKHSGKIQRGK